MTSARAVTVLALLAALVAPAPAAASFATFETGQVRPLALSPGGTQLFAVNTPDNQLEIFDVDGGTGALTHVGSVPVGLEPSAVAARTDTEVWVVNHLSDSVSIVDVGSVPPRVTRTLLVGDEPRDIVFAGALGTRAFITTAHRGQNTPFHATIDTILTTPGLGRADVWVFDALNLGVTLEGTPLSVITLFGDTPRALAASPDGSTVYAGVFHSGNQTTALSEGLVCNGGIGAAPCVPAVGELTMPGGLPTPNTSCSGDPQPEVGLIVRFNSVSGLWEDELGRDWSNGVRFDLPDQDVFPIDANLLTTGTPFASVGTILFNMAVNPADPTKVYVSNTEARNEVRFEGPGGCSTTVQGHLAESRVTVLDGATVNPRHLNKHIDYGVVPSPAGVKDASLATPSAMVVSPDGTTLYVAAFGSGKIGVFDTQDLLDDTFVPSAGSHISVSGGGPSGLVLNGTNLYVFTRFDNSVSTVDTTTGTETAHQALHNPEPSIVKTGRRFLYDAVETSSNGEAACASCHIFGDFDSLAWDLGNPDDEEFPNPNPFEFAPPPSFNPLRFEPMKGPMTTQSLRGMADHGPMHWRGDRTGGNDPGGDPLDEDAAFKKFNVAFAGLVGRAGPLTDTQMQAFTDFILEVIYPPNPIRALDNSLTVAQQSGSDFYFGANSDILRNCNGCHTLDPAQGFFGSEGISSFEGETQLVKIPHLRNIYQKVGMFGMPDVPFVETTDNTHQGDQIRGFGFLHDGSIDTPFRFFNATVFSQNGLNPGGFPVGAGGDPQRRDVESFMFAFDSTLAPIVGQQTTLTSTNSGVTNPRIDLLIARAVADECEVVVKGTLAGEQRGWYRLAGGDFQSDRVAEVPITDGALRAQASVAGQELTYTCVPAGSGERVGVDRDGDGFFDGDEVDQGSDPANPLSIPGPAVSIRGKRLIVKDPRPSEDETKRRLVLLAKETGSPDALTGDPIADGATLIVTLVGGTTSQQTFVLPAGPNWKALGSSGFKYVDSSASNGPIKLLRIKRSPSGRFLLKIVGKATSTAPIDLAPPNSGFAAETVLFIGANNRYCTTIGGPAGGEVLRDNAKLFKVKNPTTEIACP